MNPQDYDDDGNNIVPCPICLNAHCPSKQGGKCPEEDSFASANLLDDDYVPPFKPKKHIGIDWGYTKENEKELEELNRPPVTEDYEDSPFADRKPLKDNE